MTRVMTIPVSRWVDTLATQPHGSFRLRGIRSELGDGPRGFVTGMSRQVSSNL